MISMLIAVIVLVATLLAAIALMRSVDTANVVAGSMTFRQGGVQEAEKAYEAEKTTRRSPATTPRCKPRTTMPASPTS